MTLVPNPTLRRATPEDAALLAELGARTFLDSFGSQNTQEDMAAYLAASFSPERQAAELAEPGTTFLVAEVEGRPAGYAQLHSEPAPGGGTRLELVRLYADREWHGLGVGAALMKAFVDAGQAEGHGSLILCVWERNARAIAFYRKWGFREVGTKPFQLGSDLQRDLVLEREVGPAVG